jgi:hypothetical protein
MYKAHFKGTADKPGFRGLGVLVRTMSPDNLALQALDQARFNGLQGLIQQQELAEFLLDGYNPLDVPACDNVVTGKDKLLWGSVQAVKNSLQDLIKNNLSGHRFFRCMRNGAHAGDKRAWGYFVSPWDPYNDVVDGVDDLTDILS